MLDSLERFEGRRRRKGNKGSRDLREYVSQDGGLSGVGGGILVSSPGLVKAGGVS